MPTSLIVVDDFFSNAKALREAALKLNYPQVQGPYPGRNSVERINLEGLSEEVSRIVGEPLIAMDKDQAHGKCRIALESDVGKAKVHVDASHWSGILYLSNPEDCCGGTEFFVIKRLTPNERLIMTKRPCNGSVQPRRNSGWLIY